MNDDCKIPDRRAGVPVSGELWPTSDELESYLAAHGWARLGSVLDAAGAASTWARGDGRPWLTVRDRSPSPVAGELPRMLAVCEAIERIAAAEARPPRAVLLDVLAPELRAIVADVADADVLVLDDDAWTCALCDATAPWELRDDTGHGRTALEHAPGCVWARARRAVGT